MQFDAINVGAIPYGWDYNCDKEGCQNSFKSFNSEDSIDITPELLGWLDTGNMLNKPFTIGS